LHTLLSNFLKKEKNNPSRSNKYEIVRKFWNEEVNKDALYFIHSMNINPGAGDAEKKHDYIQIMFPDLPGAYNRDINFVGDEFNQLEKQTGILKDYKLQFAVESFAYFLGLPITKEDEQKYKNFKRVNYVYNDLINCNSNHNLSRITRLLNSVYNFIRYVDDDREDMLLAKLNLLRTTQKLFHKLHDIALLHQTEKPQSCLLKSYMEFFEKTNFFTEIMTQRTIESKLINKLKIKESAKKKKSESPSSPYLY
jgi:hypothetical protein